MDINHLGKRFRDSNSPRTDVGHSNLVLALAIVGGDRNRRFSRRPSTSALAGLLDGEADERDPDSVDRLVRALAAFVDRLVEHVVVGAPQTAADDLFGEER